ncbi:MAG TPA: beta-galactosidase [Planctomycetes bacterium]|nr:beta-galactosidase [Planctomycetota bacterium]
MRYRQIHLDFHNTAAVGAIAAAWDPARFQGQLKAGHVDSVTLFSKCCHGWHYHPTTTGAMHPGLSFDLLGEQIRACKAIGVATPCYLGAGLDDRLAMLHPEWERRLNDGRNPWHHTADQPGFHEMCLNTPYLDVLCAQIGEAVRNYDIDGLFLDIVSPRPCWCNTCVREVLAAGGDPRDLATMQAKGRATYLRYAERSVSAAHAAKPGLPVFHNAGNVRRGDRALVSYNSRHLELESLPTGGWGYDHFAVSAGYARTLGMPFLGMTGRFHGNWGEFGGYKHPNALRLECARMLALGAHCSVGDQLHPSAEMDAATYAIIGAAYAEVQAIEPWCSEAVNRSDVAILSLEGVTPGQADPAGEMNDNASDTGAARMLLEGHITFDLIDPESDFISYRVLVLPDAVRPDAILARRLRDFVAQGGRILATGLSGRNAGDDAFALDFACTDAGPGAFDPEYLVPAEPLGPWGTPRFLVRAAGRILEAKSGEVLAWRDEPMFNRDIRHYVSHQHAPPRGIHASAAMVHGPAGITCAHPLCRLYAEHGVQALRDLFLRALRRLLPVPLLRVSLPSNGLATVTRQEAKQRDLVHLVWAPTIKRGTGVEVVEDLVPLHAVSVELRRHNAPSRVTLVPSGDDLPFSHADGVTRFTVPRMVCAQRIAITD